MTHTDTLALETQPTTLVNGLEVEVFATEEEAQAAFAVVPFSVEQQAFTFLAASGQIASPGE